MNKQLTAKGRGIEWTDYTWNPIAGCKHRCRWTMPDGSTAICYAEDVAEGIAANAYPLGFDRHYWKPTALSQPGNVKHPARVFVGSMADVFGAWVPAAQIQAVLDTCVENPHHTFQFLTKNPKRLREFAFPRNCWVGLSAPPTHMHGKPMERAVQVRWFSIAIEALNAVDASVRWLSLEPLSFDVSDIIAAADVQWAVIGAATNGSKVYQPDPEHVQRAIATLRNMGAAVFFKGNLRGNAAAETWLEEFPAADQFMPQPRLF